MKEFLLETPVTKDFFAYLGNFGQVEALPEVGDGFYKFDKPDWFSIKGFIGDTTIEVRFKKEVIDLTVDFVYFLFASYQEGMTDLAVLKQREHAIGERVRKYLYG
ncbi:MAG: hypothetical protein LUO93_08405 [Methanomicrobiales archaeon]|nr:hypothetical protein [Methanomicrobiales archaeon]